MLHLRYYSKDLYLLGKGEADYPIVNTVMLHDILQDWVWFQDRNVGGEATDICLLFNSYFIFLLLSWKNIDEINYSRF